MVAAQYRNVAPLGQFGDLARAFGYLHGMKRYRGTRQTGKGASSLGAVESALFLPEPGIAVQVFFSHRLRVNSSDLSHASHCQRTDQLDQSSVCLWDVACLGGN